MPRVPTYGGPKIREQNSPSVRQPTDAPLEAFGGGPGLEKVTKAVSALADRGAEIAHIEKIKADDAKADQAFAEAQEIANGLLYTGDDETEAAFNQKGENAFGVSETYGKKLDERLNKISEEKLSNDSQRGLFNKMSAKVKQNFHETLTKHTFVESQKYEQQAAEAVLSSSLNDAVLNYSDPKRIHDALAIQRGKVADIAAKQGYGKEWAAHKTQEVTSKTHFEVMQQMLSNKQALVAEGYLSALPPDALTVDDRQKITRDLKTGVIQAKAQDFADKAMGEKDMTEAKALKAAREQFSGDDEVEAVREVKLRYREKEAAQNEFREKVFESVYGQIEKTGQLPEPRIMNQLSPAQRDSVYRHVETVASGRRVQTVPAVKDALIKLAKDEPEKFLKHDLLNNVAELNHKDMKWFSSLKKEIRSGGKSKELDDYRSELSILESNWRSAGFDPNPKTDREAAKLQAYRDRVADAQNREQDRTKKKLTNDEFDKIVKKQLTEVVLEKHWYGDTKKKAFEIDYDDIPKEDLKKVEAALTKIGRPINRSNVLRLYMEAVGKNAND